VQSATPRDISEAQQILQALPIGRPTAQADMLSGVSGLVTDTSGAVVPKAVLSLRDASGNVRQTATGANGNFQLSGIPAGHYDLTVTAPGFQNNQQSIDLKARELAQLEPVLTVGGASETVNVTSDAPLLQTESASISSLVAELPSHLPVASSVSLGKRILSLDRAGSLFLSRNHGKGWKKVNPQWPGKAVSLSLEAAETKNSGSKFQLTTDNGAQWTSKDGMHWRPQ
jgi:hypothetical protein